MRKRSHHDNTVFVHLRDIDTGLRRSTFATQVHRTEAIPGKQVAIALHNRPEVVRNKAKYCSITLGLRGMQLRVDAVGQVDEDNDFGARKLRLALSPGFSAAGA
jgi:hypothetical protein